MGGGKANYDFFLATFFFFLAIFKEYIVVYLCLSLNQKILTDVVEKKGSKVEEREKRKKGCGRCQEWEPGGSRLGCGSRASS